jgi:hypothetical protein
MFLERHAQVGERTMCLDNRGTLANWQAPTCLRRTRQSLLDFDNLAGAGTLRKYQSC